MIRPSVYAKVQRALVKAAENLEARADELGLGDIGRFGEQSLALREAAKFIGERKEAATAYERVQASDFGQRWFEVQPAGLDGFDGNARSGYPEEES